MMLDSAAADEAFEFSAEASGDDTLSGRGQECLVTNVFYDTYLREVLNSIAAQCEVTIVADESVTGIVTMELMEVPLLDALRRILTPYGLTFRWMDGYYLVGSPRPDNPSFPLLTKTVLYKPNFIKAIDVLRLMSTFYEPYIRANSETNTVTLTGSPELIARMKRDLADIDRPPRQVMIEALVTETSTERGRELGIAWDLGASQGRDSVRIDAYPWRVGDSAYFPEPNRLGIFFDRVGIHSSDWVGRFRAQLRALTETGEGRIRANPRIATLEGNKARIFIGREEYFSILTGSITFAYAQLEVIKTGISLTITPYVSDDGYITLEVEPQVSDVIGSGSTGLPVTNNRSVTTKVRVAEGETVVIGGLLVENQMEIERKIPLLGSIPILGYLFRHTDSQVKESEVMVLITPRLWPQEGDLGTQLETPQQSSAQLEDSTTGNSK
jgi:type IV pilus assembly protein PilQ